MVKIRTQTFWVHTDRRTASRMEAAHCLKIDVSGARNTIFFNFDFINLQNEPIFNTHVLLSPRLVLLSPGLPLLSHSLVLLSHSLVLLSPCLVSLCLSRLATHLSFLWSNRENQYTGNKSIL